MNEEFEGPRTVVTIFKLATALYTGVYTTVFLGGGVVRAQYVLSLI